MNALMGWIVQRATSLQFFIGLAVVALGCAGLGWFVGRAPLQVQLAQQTTAHAQEQVQLIRRTVAALQAAQAHGDALSAGLLQQQTQIDQLKSEATRAIKKATSGKPCLNAPALRLLNTAPGLGVRDLSPATGSTPAAGEPFATDTDVAFWIVDAGAAFETCRTRLDALIDWHTPTQPATPVTP